MLPEEFARVKIDKQLMNAGWDIVSREDYMPMNTCAVKEALMQGNTESDYLLFVEDKAIAVVEAKREENSLGDIVAEQAEAYSMTPQSWYGLWFENQIPLVYLANGKKIFFKNMLEPDSKYIEISTMHSPKKMLQIIKKSSMYGALPRIEPEGLRDCQYIAECELEKSFKNGLKKSLAILATGSGKTYLACLASYRLLNYTPTKRVLFLADRNNLARQAENEFSLFDRTEGKQPLSSLYQIKRLKKKDDISGDVVISTIQKLFAVLTGQEIIEENEDNEDEQLQENNEKDNEKSIELGTNLELPPDYFQFIVVDECHRSIYGKWKAVLDYFKDAKVLGLTATPTPEAYAFFNNNTIEKYTYEASIVDGVNVPSRVYKISTQTTVHGGTIDSGERIVQTTRDGKDMGSEVAVGRIDYAPNALDRTIINPIQMETVIRRYADAIYADLYPNREENWAYIPKTLIFAKNDNHATQIVNIVEKVFGEKFTSGNVPENFVKKITYSAGDSNALIRDFRTEKDFRIAVTVTLVATGTDIRPLEVVLFMKDVQSDVLYTQMKGRGCRIIDDAKLKEVTPNAETKECFYIVDAIGVTDSDKTIHSPSSPNSNKRLKLIELLEHLSHKELSDENLALLRDYCATINRRYENNALFGKHLTAFINDYGFSPKELANKINIAMEKHLLPDYFSPSMDNAERADLVQCLIGNINARKKLVELQKGYYAFSPEKHDEVIYAGFSFEMAKPFIENFETYINENKDKIEALRIIYNSEDVLITYSMLVDLQEKLITENRLFTPYNIWSNYKTLDIEGQVEKINTKNNVNALTNLIQIVRFAYKKTATLTSLFGSYLQRFNLYCGQAQRELTDDQKEIMQKIADYIVNEGAISVSELNSVDTDLWRKAVISFGAQVLASEMQKLSKFILKVA